MNALRTYFDRIDMIAERFEDVVLRRCNASKSVDVQAAICFAVAIERLERSCRPHPINDFVQCEIAVGVTR